MRRRQAVLGALAVLLSAIASVGLYRVLSPLEPGAQIGGSSYRLAAPGMLALLGTWPVLWWGLSISLADLARPQMLLSLLSRSVLIGVLALALAQPSRIEESSRVSAVLLVDVSDSITDADLALSQAQVQAAVAGAADGDLHVVTFAKRARVLDTPDGSVAQVARHGPELGGGADTDVQAALQLSYGLFAPGHVKHVGLMSDGLETRGDAAAESTRAAAFGIRIDTLALQGGRPAELAVRALRLPDGLTVGKTFPVRATVFASRAGRARLRLYQGATLNGLQPLEELDLPEGDTEVVFQSVVRTSGRVAYRLTLEPLSADTFDTNNEASAAALVPGQPRVLLVEGEPGRGTHLAQALAVGEYDVDLRGPAALPRTLAELDAYEFVILSDVAAELVSPAQMEIIERYVRDLGGGFLMAGGDDAFGLGGYQNTRIERLLPVHMDSERRRDEHSLALSLVIDCSGSMAGQKIELAKEAARATSELLGPQDSLAIVGFSGRPERSVRMQSARNRVKIANSIAQLSAQGGTAILPALDMAFQDLFATRARIKHVILLTDGQSPEAGIPELVQVMQDESITVSTVGLGGDVNRPLLQRVANLGGGRAYFTNDPRNVPRIFMRETTTVGRSSVVEELVQVRVAEPADFLQGIDMARAPFLRGYVATQLKPRPAQGILVSDLGEPLLARARVGLGWALAWTPDIKARWAADWLRWSQFARFWGQLVREHMRSRPTRELPMQASLQDGQAWLVVDAMDTDDSFMNGLESELRVQGPGSTPERTVTLQQSAPGRYEARVGLTSHGAYSFEASHRRAGSLVASSRAELSFPYPREYDPRAPDLALLRALSANSGGDVGGLHSLLEPGGETTQALVPVWPRLVALAIALFLVDLLLRRVRLFDRDFRRSPRGRRAD